MGTLYTRTGEKITATVETIIGTCGIESVERNPDGSYLLEYDGQGTEVCWDTAEQMKRDGQLVYQTEDGTEYLESELELRDDEEDDDAEDE